MPLTVAQIAGLCGGTLDGDGDALITGARALEEAAATDLSYASDAKSANAAQQSKARCLIVYPEFQADLPRTLIRVENPRSAFARALAALYPAKAYEPGVHRTALVADSAVLGEDVHIGPFVTIGDHSHIGPGCRVQGHCTIGAEVEIGSGSVLYAGVRIYDRVRIGSRAILHSGAVIGADGFGFVLARDRYEKFPQVGSVCIGDDVEIGANCCIDRAALGETKIGNGVKFDNLVHVGHNCNIGNHVVVAAQTGFSGSVTVGDYAVIGGQVGIGEKAHIEARAIVGGKAGILTNQKVAAGEPVWGIPARPLRQHLRGLANVAKLSEFREEFKKLKRAIADQSSNAKKLV
jgi:UDP-3-O-[3-hydroxymyristoyl] glucosamine N-acyltransferase